MIMSRQERPGCRQSEKIVVWSTADIIRCQFGVQYFPSDSTYPQRGLETALELANTRTLRPLGTRFSSTSSGSTAYSSSSTFSLMPDTGKHVARGLSFTGRPMLNSSSYTLAFACRCH